MKVTAHIYTALFLILACGLSDLRSSSDTSIHSGDDEIVHLSFQSPKLPRAELRELKRRASRKDGAAAFRLYGYYALSVESDARRSQRYFRLAVKLEYPDALYLAAVLEWSNEKVPDIDRVERYIRRSIELGHRDDRALLEEVLEARKTGVIPNRSKTRLFE